MSEEALTNYVTTSLPVFANEGRVPFADFNPWFSSLVEGVRPAYIVGIARGAVRLLQLQDINDVIGDIPIISDHALPFLPDSAIKSKSILLFDDSVIFGSTLSDVRNYLLERGAIVSCAAYIIDRTNFYGETEPTNPRPARPSYHSDIPVQAKHLLWPSHIRKHHSALIDSILQTPRDYNLDFPKFCLELPQFTAGDISYLIRLLEGSEVIRGIYDVTTPASALGGAYRYTALLKPRVVGLSATGNFLFRPYSKARLTFIPERGEIHLTPMQQLIMADDTAFDHITFEAPFLQEQWERLHPPRSKSDRFYQRAIFRLLTSFVAVVMGERLTREFAGCLLPEFPVGRVTLIEEDVKAIVGPDNSSAIQEIRSALQAHGEIDELTTANTVFTDDSEGFFDEKLLLSIKEEWDDKPFLQPHTGEPVYEVLGKVFLTLRAVTDSHKCREDNPAASRLDIGLSFGAIRRLLSEYCDIDFTADELSVGIDMCVDNGQAVPKVIKLNSVWLRAFYSGEGEDAHKTLQLKDAIRKGYEDFLRDKSGRRLTEFDMHKLGATLRDIFNWLPITTKPYTFGRYTMIGDTEIVSWLVNMGSGPLRLEEDDEGRKVLCLNESYESCVDDAWDPNKSKDFLDAFQYLATAFTKFRGDAPKLLISTCRTHRHTYNAVAVEAHNWVINERGNFNRLLASARLTHTGELQYKENVLTSIYWCARYISEARLKYDIFHKQFEPLKQQIAKAFEAQGGGAKRFWQYILLEANKLDPSINREMELRFSYLLPLLNQLTELTAYTTRLLLDLGYIQLNELEDTFARNKSALTYKNFSWLTSRDARTAASYYNDYIRKMLVTAPSIETTLLQTDVPSPGGDLVAAWYGEALKTVQKCFQEVSSSLSLFCPRYKTEEGEFPFAPDNDKRVLSDNSVERVLRDHFILTVEIIKSTNSVQTNRMKDFVLQTFDTFKGNVYYDKTGNDAFVACSKDPMILRDISRLLMQHGEYLKNERGEFGGTRKGLFHGTVRCVVDTEGQMMISDAVTPNVLPQAFYILNGIDKHFESQSDKKNSIIIMDEYTANLVGPIFKLNYEASDSFKVTSKHFMGNCYCFSLEDWTIQ